MSDNSYNEMIMRGHFLYWDMLGQLSGIENHQEEKLRWLTGDINYTYFTDTSEINELVARINKGEIPNNLYFFSDDLVTYPATLYLESGLFEKDAETFGMAHELDKTVQLEPNQHLELFQVKDLIQLKMVSSILNTAFEYNLFSFAKYREMFRNEGQYFYLAEYDGVPASAIMVQDGDDFVNISWVGTLAGYRQLGLAGHLIQMAEYDALSRGKTLAVLQGYTGIIGAYRHIGYKEYFRGVGVKLIEKIEK